MAAVEEITGSPASLVYTSPVGDYVVARLGDGRVVRGPIESPLKLGVPYRFAGKWEVHQKHGRQFAFATCGMESPVNRRGMIAYLTSICPGVGEQRAAALWERFGVGAADVLRHRPGEVVEAGILRLADAQEASQALHDEGAFQATRIELLSLFAGRGFPAAKLIRECLALWGVRAPAVVRGDPFTLLVRRLPGCGFKRCDTLYRDLGHDLRRLKRQALAVWHCLRSDSTGHTWFPATLAGQLLCELIPDAEPLRALRCGERAGLLSIRRGAAGGPWVAEAAKANDEERLALSLTSLLSYERRMPEWGRRSRQYDDSSSGTPAATSTTAGAN